MRRGGLSELWEQTLAPCEKPRLQRKRRYAGPRSGASAKRDVAPRGHTSSAAPLSHKLPGTPEARARAFSLDPRMIADVRREPGHDSSSSQASPTHRFLVGDRVDVCFNGSWYAATVTSLNADGTYAVQYCCDGKHSMYVPWNLVRAPFRGVGNRRYSVAKRGGGPRREFPEFRVPPTQPVLSQNAPRPTRLDAASDSVATTVTASTTITHLYGTTLDESVNLPIRCVGVVGWSRWAR